jgi:hypothetical protein
MKLIFNILLIVSVTVNAQQYETTGFFERYDSAVNKIVSANAKAEIVAKGFSWSEGALFPLIQFINGRQRKVLNYI